MRLPRDDRRRQQFDNRYTQRYSMFSEEILKEISDTLRRISVGRCSIALAGSHAYNASDEMSDIDIYMLIDEAKPHDEICALINEIADGNAPVSVSYSFDAAPYGGGIDFSFSKVPVEVTVKYFSMIQERIDSCIEGRFEIIPQSWTSNGYYTYISLSEMDFIKPIYETDGFIKACKERLAEYPKPLKKSIIDTFMRRARTWIGNFHYESAIERADYMFCAPIVFIRFLTSCK